ncbi:MAG: hypothetical protein ATN31_00035 [Candidatus Epulonipiscioides saccharophilum]|nr:MAG: hypothetical protein ATN31_00035 [Epulopiscium sp. AS2M-Bin001]
MFKGNLFRVMMIVVVFTFGYVVSTTLLGFNPGQSLVNMEAIVNFEATQMASELFINFSIMIVMLLGLRKVLA